MKKIYSLLLVGIALSLFCAKRAEAQVILTAPANGASFCPTSIGFTWNAYPGASRYVISVYNGMTLVVSDTTAATSQAYSNLVGGTTYTWNVYAINGANTTIPGSLSETRTFNTLVLSTPYTNITADPGDKDVLNFCTGDMNITFIASGGVDGELTTNTEWYDGDPTNGGVLRATTANDSLLVVDPAVTFASNTIYVRRVSDCGASPLPNYFETISYSATPSTDPLTLAQSGGGSCPGSAVTLSIADGDGTTGDDNPFIIISSDPTFATDTLLYVADVAGATESVIVNPTTSTTYYAQRQSNCNPAPATVSTMVTVLTPSVAPTTIYVVELLTGDTLPADTTVCPNQQLVITTNFVGNGDGAFTQWLLNGVPYPDGDGDPNTFAAGTDTTFSADATISVRVDPANPGCVTPIPAAVSTAISIKDPATAPSFVITDQPGYCSGEDVFISAGGGFLGEDGLNTTLDLYEADQVTLVESLADTGDTVNFSAISGLAPANYTYYVQRTDDCGRTTLFTAVNFTVSAASINPTAVNGVPNPANCPGDPVTLTASGYTLAADDTLIWYADSVAPANEIYRTINPLNNTVVVNPTAATDYYAVISGNCIADPSTQTFTTVNITNTSSTAPANSELSVNDADSIVCAGDMVTLTLQDVGKAGSGSNVVWYVNSTLNPPAQTLAASNPLAYTYTATVNANTVYLVRFEGGTCPVVTATAQLPVNISAAPTAPTSIFADPGTSTCPGDAVTLTAIGGSLGDNGGYRWYANSVAPINLIASDTNSITVAPGSTTSYFVTIADDTCGTESAAASTTITTSNTGSTAYTTVSKSTDNYCPNTGQVLVLTANGGTDGTGAVTRWYTSNPDTATTSTPVAVFSGSNIYTLNPGPDTTTTYWVRREGTCDTSASIAITVFVKTASVAPTGISVTNDTVCAGTPITFVAQGGVQGTGATLQWFNSQGVMVGTGNPLLITITQDTMIQARYSGDCNVTAFTDFQAVTVFDENDVTVMNGFTCLNTTLDLNTLVNPTGGSFTGEGVSGHFFNAPGNETYTITYNKSYPGGCFVEKTFEVTVTTPPSVIVNSVTPAGCNDNTGAIQISGSGGLAPYVFSKNNGGTYQASGSFTGLTSGIYYMVVRDDNGCVSAVDTVPVGNSTGLSIILNSVANVSCFGGENGAIYVSASGGLSPFSFAIDKGDGFETNTPSTNGTFVGLSAGIYNIRVTDSNSPGCTATLVGVQVTQPNNPVDLTVDFYSNLTCHNSNDGRIENIFASGGSGNYRYSINGSDFTTQTTYTGLAEGLYTITVRDGNGCEYPFVFSIEAPDSITAVVDILDFDEVDGYDVELTLGGGTGALIVKLNQGQFSSETTFTNLQPGTYTYTVKDQNGCTTTGTFILEDQTSVNETVAATLSIYPNPFRGNLTVTGTLPVGAKIIMLDVFGKLVSVETATEGDNTVINTDHLASGMYFLNISGEGMNITKKVIKE